MYTLTLCSSYDSLEFSLLKKDSEVVLLLTNHLLQFIFDAAVRFCVEIGTEKNGCCVLQRCIEHSTGIYQDMLVAEISKNAFLLAQDPYGYSCFCIQGLYFLTLLNYALFIYSSTL